MKHATPDQVEYLKNRVKRQEDEIKQMKAGMEELQQAIGILVKQMILELGGDTHEVTLRKRKDLDTWKEEIERNQKTGELKIKLIKA